MVRRDSTGEDAVESWREFYDRSFGDVARYALRLTGGNRASAEDLTHDAYLAMVRAWREGRVDRLETGWLIVVVRQRFLNGLRSQLREDRRLRLLQGGAAVADSHEGTSIADLFVGLSDRERGALVLRYVDDLPVAEVAEALGLSVHAAESLLARARANMRRDRLEDRHG